MISSVTHINSFSADQTKAEAIHAGATPPSTLAPAAQLVQLGEGSQTKADISGFVRNPKLVKEDIMLQRVELGSFRDALDLPGLLEQALLLKDEANLQFAEGRWRVAMVGYLTGLWLLRGGGAACPLLTCAALADREATSKVLNGVAKFWGVTNSLTGASKSAVDKTYLACEHAPPPHVSK